MLLAVRPTGEAGVVTGLGGISCGGDGAAAGGGKIVVTSELGSRRGSPLVGDALDSVVTLETAGDPSAAGF
jgi:hypothetical protein